MVVVLPEDYLECKKSRAVCAHFLFVIIDYRKWKFNAVDLYVNTFKVSLINWTKVPENNNYYLGWLYAILKNQPHSIPCQTHDLPGWQHWSVPSVLVHPRAQRRSQEFRIRNSLKGRKDSCRFVCVRGNIRTYLGIFFFYVRVGFKGVQESLCWREFWTKELV